MKGSFWCIWQYQKILLMALSFHPHRNCRLHRSEIEKKEQRGGVGESEADTQLLLFCCSVSADSRLLHVSQEVPYNFCPYSKRFCRQKTWHNRYVLFLKSAIYLTIKVSSRFLKFIFVYFHSVVLLVQERLASRELHHCGFVLTENLKSNGQRIVYNKRLVKSLIRKWI